MMLLIILIYFMIGFVVGLFVYDYFCKDFDKKDILCRIAHRVKEGTWEG